MAFIDSIIVRAKADKKTIVLPEAYEPRVLRATDRILKEAIANVILIGNPERIKAAAGTCQIDGARIIDPDNFEQYEQYAEAFYELRKKKGMTIEKAREQLKEPMYFAVMLVKMDAADGVVSGSVNSTANTLRPALQILKTAPGTKLVSAFFLMSVPDCAYGEAGTFLFADCGLNENPDAEQLAEIAIASGKSFQVWTGKEARVALLSYSSKGSASSELVDKVSQATALAKSRAPELALDGELQLDAAIVPEVARSKAPGSAVAGRANTLIFPDLNAGNIGYKLVQRLAKAEAYGPILQGIAAPVNDLSRGCSADDIVGVVAITAVQAQNLKA
ncbi:MAG: phosphate acetyltransferase [Oscillospiraceae bacterium]|nr:phosphate acetyltransferase [Oscillospiraceae bacterium]MDD4367731.1 phosphate acetyltransferase [Oscillospiraceae bacterium]